MLDVSDISVDFGGVQALQDISFSVESGEFLGLIGPNGAGKTTLMRVITGVVKPTGGQVYLNKKALNRKHTHARIRMGIGLSQQIVHPFRSMSVLENVAFSAGYTKTKNPMASLLKISRKKERRNAIELLEAVGIAHVADAQPSSLPLGIIKRLELARALALKPVLLLLDEPLAGLNQKEARQLSDTLSTLNSQGQTIVLIEHNLGEVIRICQRLVVIDNGFKIKEGSPTSVMQDPAVRSAYLGKA